jgi:hypothetical protein
MKPIFTLIYLLFNILAFGQKAKEIYNMNVGSTVKIIADNGQGSGFFVGPNIIATNYHVVEGATIAECEVNGSNFRYEIEGYVAADRDLDLILLKVKGLNRPKVLMASNPVSPGDPIYVIGSPLGLSATISDGIVSGLRAANGFQRIQISAPISPGSSGGAVFNDTGELIGIAVSTYLKGQNLNFAIPISYLKILLENKKSSPLPLVGLYSKPTSLPNANYFERDETYGLGLKKRDNVKLSLDYLANIEEYSCFSFTYDMTESYESSTAIWMADYRLFDLRTGEVYNANWTDLPAETNPRIVYRGTKTRFRVCFDRLPSSVNHFSLMESECEENSFCFLNLDLSKYSPTSRNALALYDNTSNNGTITFYQNQKSIGEINIWVEGIHIGSLPNYFTNPQYIPDCSVIGDATLTLRLPAGTYHYTAKSEYINWDGTFTIEPEDCQPFRLYQKSIFKK